MQMKCDPINGLLIRLVRLYEEVSPVPWIEPCLFWTCLTHVTASLQSHPPSPNKLTQMSSLNPCFTPISSIACVHNRRHSAWEKNHMQGSQ